MGRPQLETDSNVTRSKTCQPVWLHMQKWCSNSMQRRGSDRPFLERKGRCHPICILQYGRRGMALQSVHARLPLFLCHPPARSTNVHTTTVAPSARNPFAVYELSKYPPLLPFQRLKYLQPECRNPGSLERRIGASRLASSLKTLLCLTSVRLVPHPTTSART